MTKPLAFRGRRDFSDAIIALSITIVTVSCAVAYSRACVHWFVVPLSVAGTLSGIDAVKWARGRLDVLDPIGIVGAALFYSCFLTPLLHVCTDRWMAYVIPPDDWRPWIGLMGILNGAGLVLYRWVVSKRGSAKHRTRSIWLVQEKRFVPLAMLMIVASATLQGYVYYVLGGFTGVTDSYKQMVLTGQDALVGKGWITAIAESLPMLVMLTIAVLTRKRRIRMGWVALTTTIAALGLLQLICGGFRGSRGNTVWTIVWTAGIIHLWIRRVPRTAMAFGALTLLLFMYVAGFYKAVGLDALEILGGEEYREDLSQRTGRDLGLIFLGDLERSDVQAFALYRLLSPDSTFQYAWGQTYYGALALLVPKAIWDDRPPSKVKWTTETEYGAGTYGSRSSSRIYGLAGETALNFSPWLIPLAFGALAFITCKAGEFIRGLATNDVRLLYAPLLILLCPLMLSFDSDNLLWIVIKVGGIPLILLALSARRYKLNAYRLP